MRFEQPWVSLLLAVVAAAAWWRARRGGEAALAFSSAEPAASLPRTRRARLARLPYRLRVAALCLLIVALARPQTGGERTREPGEGIAIQMAIDRSGSMKAPIYYRGRQTTRLELAKHFLLEFVAGDGRELKGRGSDAIGLVAFARYSETVCPLTFSHDAFRGLVARIRPAEEREENATAIGDAVALAAARLKQAAGREAKGRVIVLLSDGLNTAGARSVADAAQLARSWGVRVHAIGIVGPAPASAFGLQSRIVGERELGGLAAATGGIYRSVQDGGSLQSVYAEIDRLEKSRMAATRYTGGTERFGPPALAGLGLLLASAVLGCTWLRRIP